jgi:ribonuclease R
MYDRKISFQIKQIFEKDTHKSLNINELSRILRVGKHKKKDLKDTLFAMVREGLLSYKSGKYYLGSIPNEYTTGVFDSRSLAKNRSYAFVNSDDGDIFVSSEDILNAYDGDLVEVKVKSSAKDKRSGIITKIVKRSRQEFVGTIQLYGKNTYLIPDNTRIHTNFKVLDLKNARNNDKVVMKITNWGSKEYSALPAGDVIEILGQSGNPEVEILGVIRHYGLPLEFPPNVINELDNIVKVNYEEESGKRIDKRELTTITIDPISAKDYDDAISLEKNENGYRLFVHIADVAHYVKKGSALFSEALNRGNSYYFPKRVIPMLPEKISNGLCSLRPLEDKLTVTVETLFDRSYKIIDQRVYESVIRSDLRLNYEEVDQLFEQKEHQIPENIAELLQEMQTLSSALSKNRFKAGYLKFNLPETQFIFDDEGHIIDLKRSSETDSHKMIENFMLIANEYIAEQLSKDVTIYRIHELPDEQRTEEIRLILEKYDCKIPGNNNLNVLFQNLLDQLGSPERHRVFDRMILRSMKRARYSIENLGHFGLAIRNYTHFTSPIRRISDLIVHHQIKDRINSQDPQFSRQELFDYAEMATDREKIADDSEKEVELKNKIVFMKKHLGEEFSSVIVAVRNSSIIVELDRYPVSGIIELSSLKDDYYEFLDEYKQLIGSKTGKIYKLADKVNVLVSKVTDDVYLQMV